MRKCFKLAGMFVIRGAAASSSPNFLNLLLQNRRALKMASWSCKACTFRNPPSQKTNCQICLSPSVSSPPAPPATSLRSPSSSSSASVPMWSCKACTFLNTYKNSNCEVCDTRAPVSSLSSFEDLNDTGPDAELDSSVGSVFFPLQRCNKRKGPDIVEVDRDSSHLGGFRGSKASQGSDKAATVKGAFFIRCGFYFFPLFHSFHCKSW